MKKKKKKYTWHACGTHWHHDFQRGFLYYPHQESSLLDTVSLQIQDIKMDVEYMNIDF